ncbi:hypothetical protein [Caenispirillum salinarum]|uniref:hypothetical protein n=1 Tax=Caenispirillum salinarum TaxID=859058 RepID=UPI00384FB780
MPYYHVNKNAQSNGDHEVHESSCKYGAQPENQEPLGWHDDCEGAVSEAKKKGYSTANGCYYCCYACHTT